MIGIFKTFVKNNSIKFFIVALTILFLSVYIWHGGGHFGHEDEHDDCAVCYMLSQNTSFNAFEVVAVIVVFVIIKILKTITFLKHSSVKSTTFSRAPPCLI
ncbi:MAG: hypothetical protein LBL00_08160 [Endomicrobium sp.]|jgi:hypothetical protein|nr:hypothetical protein [Endomicrobium sp.]